MFGQLALCWHCGGALRLVIVGLVTQPEWIDVTADWPQDPGQDAVLAGCLVEGYLADPEPRQCLRCGAATSPRAVVDGPALRWPFSLWAAQLEHAARASDRDEADAPGWRAVVEGPDDDPVVRLVPVERGAGEWTMRVMKGEIEQR